MFSASTSRSAYRRTATIPAPSLPPGQTFAAVGPRRATRWHRALTPSQTCSQRVLMLNRIRWRLAAEIIDPTFAHGVRYWHKADIPSALHMPAFGGKADMTFCVAHVCL